jgi:hypothetical protein
MVAALGAGFHAHGFEIGERKVVALSLADDDLGWRAGDWLADGIELDRVLRRVGWRQDGRSRRWSARPRRTAEGGKSLNRSAESR